MSKMYISTTMLLVLLLITKLLFTQSIGNRIIVIGANGKNFNAVIKDILNDQYLIQNDGYDTKYWVSRNQIKLLDTQQNEQYSKPNLPETATKNVTDIKTDKSLKIIYDFGAQKGWTSQLYNQKFDNYIQKFTAQEQTVLLNFLNQANTSSARFFALKSLIIGESYQTVKEFITQLNEYNEIYQQEKCIITTDNSLVQQWQFSCSITLIQAFLADLSPRYTWNLKHINNFDKINNDPNCPIAVQQKELLEKYGGTATARGDVSGTSIGIITPLKELVTPILGVSFYAQEVTEPLPNLFAKIRAQLDQGINTPLLIAFGGSTAKHFIMVMRYKNTNDGFQYLIYDPWEGKCSYVLETTIFNGSLSPILDQKKISIDYYYPTY